MSNEDWKDCSFTEKEKIKMAGTFDLNAMLAGPQLSVAYKRAAEVDAQIKQSAMQAQQNLYDMAMGFKKMRDEKLYTALGYENFGDYCEKETEMKRQSVYRYISIVEKLPENLSHRCDKIGMTKLQLLTTIDDEQREELIETTDLESTSVRELKEIIKDLQAKNDDLTAECRLADIKRKEETEKLEENLQTLKKAQNTYEKDLKNMTNEKLRLEKQLSEQQNNYSMHTKRREEKIAELEQKIDDLNQELENRPIDIAVTDNSEEIDKLKSQLEEAQNELEQARNEPVSKNLIRYMAALNGAEKALHELLLASLNYKNCKHNEVKSLIDKFMNDFDKCCKGDNS